MIVFSGATCPQRGGGMKEIPHEQALQRGDATVSMGKLGFHNRSQTREKFSPL